MSKLLEKHCVPCEGGVEPLKGDELKKLQKELGGDWTIVDDHHIEKEYAFKNFVKALEYTNKVGIIAEQEGHHPDILLSWGKVKVTSWTHAIGGLSDNDFILAAKCDAVY